MALTQEAAGKTVTVDRGGAMVGCFAGLAVLGIIGPGTALAAAASGYSLLAVGSIKAIMFPTIFSLASTRLGSRASDGHAVTATRNRAGQNRRGQAAGGSLRDDCA